MNDRSWQAVLGWLLMFAVAAWPDIARAEPVKGAVLDGETLEPVSRATVKILGVGIEVRTDEVGGFTLDDIPAGVVDVRIEAEGYEPAEEQLNVPVGGVKNATFVLLRPGAASEIIEMSGSGPPLPTPPGKTELRREELTRIPGTRGDALTSIKSLPGVANVNPGGAGPGVAVIRGAAPEDSKVLIDGIEIPLLYHFFGLQSIVPSEFINTINFLPGGFGAEQGGATGGVISIATRAEPVTETSGFAELSFINLAAYVQGPISKKHGVQFAAGLRRSAIDLLLPAVIPDDTTISFTTAPQYYDGQLRVDWRRDARNRFTFLGLGSFDLLTLLNDTLNPNEPLLQGKWENETSFARALGTWQYSTAKLDNRLVVAPGITGFRFEIGDDRFLRFNQTSFELRDDLNYRPSKRLSVRTGTEIRFRSVELDSKFPLAPQEGTGGAPTFSNQPPVERMDNFTNHTVGAWAIVDFKPRDGTTITPGLRVDYFDRIGQTSVLPRLSIEQKLHPKVTARLAMGSYSRQGEQGEQLQTTLLPELATQYVVGGDYKLVEGVKLSGSVFYTDRRQLIVQDPVMAANDPDNAYVNDGYGRSYGFEALLQARRDKFFGWLSYTLSRSDRVDRPLSDQRLFDFDQTHNFIAVGSYTLGAWEFGARWQYSTGNPVTPINGSIYLSDLNIYLPVLGDINSDRLEPAHQMDIRIDRKWQFRNWAISAYLDVTNVYANPRTLAYRYNFDYSQREAIAELPIVPALGVRGSF